MGHPRIGVEEFVGDSPHGANGNLSNCQRRKYVFFDARSEPAAERDVCVLMTKQRATVQPPDVDASPGGS